MARLAAVTAVSLAMAVVVSAQALQRPRFVPPRLKTAELPPLPGVNVPGGGEVLIEALVDRNGAVRRPAIIRATPPFTELVLDAVARWRFDPARDIDSRGVETIVQMPVAIFAIYRPPILMNAPTVGEPPKEWGKLSAEAASPIATAAPNYPPQARAGGVVVTELSLNEQGGVTDTRMFASVAGFESASREALAGWRFRGGSYRARPVPSTAYALFGFRPPVGMEQEPCRPNDERLMCKPCQPNDPRPACRPETTPGAAMLLPPFGVLSFR
jgi:hypothetical protein